MLANPRHATDSHPRTCDVAIVGAGIFGLFCALTLAEAGKSVVVIDRRKAWSEASAVNAGSLGVQNKLPALVPYTLWAWELWEGMAKRLGVDVGVRSEGGYKIATSEAEAERLHEVARQQRACGLDAVALDATELRRTAPWISHECVAATFSPQDGFTSPTLVGPALLCTIWRGRDLPLTTIGVAARPRRAADLWSLMHETSAGYGLATDPGEVPPVPWCAVRVEPSLMTDPDEPWRWLAAYEVELATAWIERRHRDA